MLLWPKPGIEYVEVPVYIPVANEGKPREVRWEEDVAYLQGVMALRTHDVFRIEVLHALTLLRNTADVAKSPAVLEGYQEGIKILKSLLSLHVQAKARVAQIMAAKKQEKELKDNDTDGHPSR